MKASRSWYKISGIEDVESLEVRTCIYDTQTVAWDSDFAEGELIDTEYYDFASGRHELLYSIYQRCSEGYADVLEDFKTFEEADALAADICKNPQIYQEKKGVLILIPEAGQKLPEATLITEDLL
jgi:hypothetical protein